MPPAASPYHVCPVPLSADTFKQLQRLPKYHLLKVLSWYNNNTKHDKAADVLCLATSYLPHPGLSASVRAGSALYRMEVSAARYSKLKKKKKRKIAELSWTT